MNGLLTELKSAFDTANTTTASPIDLSANMTQRVKHVQTVNPAKLTPQAEVLPFVTCFITAKTMSEATIAKGQANGKRKAVVDIDIVGTVWNDTFNTAHDDPADKDIHYLMENIELILRSNENLNSKALFHSPSGCRYYDEPTLEEEAHLRSGILSLKVTCYY